MVQNLFTISIVFARFICNHYTAKGQEKDSAFSYPKPQLMLTKPKLFVPFWDKKLPKVDNYLLFFGCKIMGLRQNKKSPIARPLDGRALSVRTKVKVFEITLKNLKFF